MGLFSKVMLIIGSILILSVYTSVFTIINKDSPYKNFFNRLTTEGWYFCVLVTLLIILNIYVEVGNDKENTKNALALDDIKKALVKNSLEYDTNSKTIIDNRVINQSAGIITGDNAVMDNVSVLYSPPHYVDADTKKILPFKLLPPSQINTILDLVKKQALILKTKDVFVFTRYTENQQNVVNQLNEALSQNGFFMIGTGTLVPDPKDPKEYAIVVQPYKDKIGILLFKN